MAEPHTTVAAGLIQGIGISSVTLLLGAQVDALVVGLLAAVLVSFWLDTIDNKKKAAAAVVLSAMFAGYGSPVAAEWIAFKVAGIGSMDQLRIFLAVIIGAVSPTIAPLLLNLLSKTIKGAAQ